MLWKSSRLSFVLALSFLFGAPLPASAQSYNDLTRQLNDMQWQQYELESQMHQMQQEQRWNDFNRQMQIDSERQNREIFNLTQPGPGYWVPVPFGEPLYFPN